MFRQLVFFAHLLQLNRGWTLVAASLNDLIADLSTLSLYPPKGKEQTCSFLVVLCISILTTGIRGSYMRGIERELCLSMNRKFAEEYVDKLPEEFGGGSYTDYFVYCFRGLAALPNPAERRSAVLFTFSLFNLYTAFASWDRLPYAFGMKTRTGKTLCELLTRMGRADAVQSRQSAFQGLMLLAHGMRLSVQCCLDVPVSHYHTARIGERMAAEQSAVGAGRLRNPQVRARGREKGCGHEDSAGEEA
ncbi:MAG: hypothetical protein P4M11_08990 [Candidatus Pacebacteria bacterium]|nr:hypothetical protein [Candidatus Paceibacterota bacterium]